MILVLDLDRIEKTLLDAMSATNKDVYSNIVKVRIWFLFRQKTFEEKRTILS